jgi:enoyl-CoA hydratase/carnithine racemase
MKIRFERHEHVGLALLDDEPRRNVLSRALVRELLDVLHASRAERIRALVIGSAGTLFCAGADISEMLGEDWDSWIDPQPDRPTPLDLFEAIETDPRPILAAVDGLALGGGVELTLACDLVVAGANASFMFPELGHGAIPNTAIARLPALIGARAARDLILTRRRVAADEAQQMGLVNRVVTGTPLQAAAIALATSIASAPPAALAAVKQGIERKPDWPTIRRMLRAMKPDEYNEGFAAFVEKRRPSFDAHWDRS